jgi:hypothetical protein
MPASCGAGLGRAVHGSCRDEPVVILAGQGHRPALTAVPHRGTRPQVRAADGDAMTETAPAELLSRDLSGLDVAVS